jgi:hypothetical protein
MLPATTKYVVIITVPIRRREKPTASRKTRVLNELKRN